MDRDALVAEVIQDMARISREAVEHCLNIDDAAAHAALPELMEAAGQLSELGVQFNRLYSRMLTLWLPPEEPSPSVGFEMSRT